MLYLGQITLINVLIVTKVISKLPIINVLNVMMKIVYTVLEEINVIDVTVGLLFSK